jgi:hypothetical protein
VPGALFAITPESGIYTREKNPPRDRLIVAVFGQNELDN